MINAMDGSEHGDHFWMESVSSEPFRFLYD